MDSLGSDGSANSKKWNLKWPAQPARRGGRNLSELRFDPNPQSTASAAEMNLYRFVHPEGCGALAALDDASITSSASRRSTQWSRNRRFSIAVSNQKQASCRL